MILRRVYDRAKKLELRNKAQETVLSNALFH